MLHGKKQVEGAFYNPNEDDKNLHIYVINGSALNFYNLNTSMVVNQHCL